MKQITHNRILAFALAVSSLLLMASGVHAQTEGVRPSFEAGAYTFNLGLTAGYRTADITDFDGTENSWATNRYYEAYNLRKGINLNSFNLFGERHGDEGFFDELYINAYGLNDPFTTGSLRMRAFNKFDLKVDFRQAQYFLNRNDSIFTGLHKYDMTRDFLNASLDINASEDLKINLKFNSISRSGDMTTTMSPFIENAEESIGSYVGGIFRGEFYWLKVPKNDKTTEFSAGLTYKLPAASSISLGGGLRTFTQEFTPTLVSDTSLTYTNFASPYSFLNSDGINGYWAVPSKTNPKGATPFESLNIKNYTDHRESSGPFVYFQGVTKPVDALTVTADVRYEASKSKPFVKYDFGGTARTGGTITYDTSKASATYGQVSNYAKVFAPYEAVLDGSADVMDWNSLVANVALSAQLVEDLTLNANVGMSQINESVEAKHNVTITADTGTKVLNAVTRTVQEELKVDYKIPQQNFDAFVAYSPMIEGFGPLGVRAGVKYMGRKPEITEDEKLDTAISREWTALTPYISINLRPMDQLRLDARFSQTTRTAKNADGTDADMPIRTAPEKILNISGGVAYEPIKRLNLAARYNAINGTSTFNAVHLPWTASAKPMNLPELDFTNDASSITGSIGYFVKDIKLGFNVSGQYKENKYSIPTTWTRGSVVPTTTPGYIDSMTVLVTQNTIDRFVDLSLNWEPIESLHLDGGLMLTRSTGTPSTFVNVAAGIVGDTTRFGGPYSMQNIHASASYDVTPNIGVSVDFQHVAYKEDKEGSLWGLNNFAGNLIRGGFALKF